MSKINNCQVIDVNLQKKKSRKAAQHRRRTIKKVLSVLYAVTIIGASALGISGLYNLHQEKEKNWDAYIETYAYYNQVSGNATSEGYNRFLANHKLEIEGCRLFADTYDLEYDKELLGEYLSCASDYFEEQQEKGLEFDASEVYDYVTEKYERGELIDGRNIKR